MRLAPALLIVLSGAALSTTPVVEAQASPRGSDLRVVAHDSEKPLPPSEEAAARITEIHERIAAEPRQRAHRFELVQNLLAAGQREQALAAAREWREHDAYNLVAVRVLGDLLTELGHEREALRVYSAVTELLAEDAGAQRSLASVLKRQGRLDAARERLTRAVELAPDDARLRLELADVELRTGHEESARVALEALAAKDDLPRALRHPTSSRLAQLYSKLRREAALAGDSSTAQSWGTRLDALEIAGGLDNDIRVYLSWDTDRSDVDLWVTTPSGEKIFYSHKKGKRGEALYHDITNGYGPETLTVPRAEAGEYKVEVNYFSTGRTSFSDARGEVTIVLHEGSDDEEVHRLPYRLHKSKETLHVASVEVGA